LRAAPHVLEDCEECKRTWDNLVESRRADLRELLAGETDPIPFDDTLPAGPLTDTTRYESAFSGAARKVTRAATRLTYEKRRVRRDLEELLAIQPNERSGSPGGLRRR
jgi:hypothetical protein